MSNSPKTPAEIFYKKYEGTAPLNFCPKCGHAIVDSQIGISDTTVLNGKACGRCGYIHNMQILTTQKNK